MTVKVRGPGLASLEANVAKLLKSHVLVGIPNANAERATEPGGGATINNAAIGYLMETGAPERNIPERPFLVPGVQAIQDRAVQRLKIAAQAALIGDEATIESQLDAIGGIAVGSVQERITDGPFVSLSERTLKQRKAKGRTGTKPLIDTGQLRRAVNYVIRKKGS